jgi:hypothetical protein
VSAMGGFVRPGTRSASLATDLTHPGSLPGCWAHTVAGRVLHLEPTVNHVLCSRGWFSVSVADADAHWRWLTRWARLGDGSRSWLRRGE